MDKELYGRSYDDDVVVSQMEALARCYVTSSGLELDLPMVLLSPPEVDPLPWVPHHLPQGWALLLFQGHSPVPLSSLVPRTNSLLSYRANARPCSTTSSTIAGYHDQRGLEAQ